MPAPRPIRRPLLTVLAALLAAAGMVVLRPSPAAAVVTPLHGYHATVDGFTSWYGSYGMSSLGTAWCIDHGIRAPDPAFAYARADLSAVPADTRAAMAWVLGVHARGTDRVRHAAVMLVLHDLMGARYPSGPLDLDRLPTSRLSGFGGHEASVLAQARVLKADGLAHRDLRGRLSLRVAIEPVEGGAAPVTASVRDANDRPVAGIAIELQASPGTTLATSEGTTRADGTWRTIARPVRLPLTVRANALVPRLDLDAWAPTTRAAQRVARPIVEAATASAGLAVPPPATTTTTALPPTTTTTAPTTTTTTTTVPPTTTVAPTTTTTAAVVAPPSTTTSTTTAAPPVTVLGAPPGAPTLPRTGSDVAALALTALGLVLIGSAALDVAAAPRRVGPPGGRARRRHLGDVRRRVEQAQPSAPASRSAAMRSSP